MQKCTLLFAAMLLLAGSAWAQNVPPPDSIAADRSFIITDPKELLQHDGGLVTVEGCVVRAGLKEQVKGKPIFLDLFTAYPDNILTVAIWEEDQAQFLSADAYNQKLVRVTGKAKKKVYAPAGKTPQERVTISLHDPKQITILSDCPPAGKQ